MSDLCVMPWTDADGVVHERQPDAARTLCGVDCTGETRPFAARIGCDACVQASMTDYSRRHRCSPQCRPQLDRRVPGESDGARIARVWSMSGVIEPAEPCDDRDLIKRIDHGLRAYQRP